MTNKNNHYRVAVYGLTTEQQDLLEAALPKGYTPVVASGITDIIIMDSVCTVIDLSQINREQLRPLLAYCMDMDFLLDTFVWLGTGALPGLEAFIRYDSFLSLLLNCSETMEAAQCRYERLQQYTDVYSHLPRHAIEETLEADYFAAIDKYMPQHPIKDARKQWQQVLEISRGAELLAAMCELCRWLQKSGIPYRLTHRHRWSLFVLLFFLTEDGIDPTAKEEFSVTVSRDALPQVTQWLQYHWFFRETDLPKELFRLRTHTEDRA